MHIRYPVHGYYVTKARCDHGLAFSYHPDKVSYSIFSVLYKQTHLLAFIEFILSDPFIALNPKGFERSKDPHGCMVFN